MRLSLALLSSLFAATFVAGTSFATVTPVPGCARYGLDYDGDGFCVADPARPAPADKDALEAYTANIGPKDCNDSDPGLNPGAREIVGDGIDQDCSAGGLPAGDLTFNTPDATARAFGCDPKSARCMKVLESEIEACTSVGSAQCEVVVTAGRFALKRGFHFLDTDCTNGREVVSQDEYDAFLADQRTARRDPTWVPDPALQGRCVAQSNCAPAQPCRHGTARPKPKAKPASGVAADALRALREADKGINLRLDGQRKAIDENEDALNVLREKDVETDKRLDEQANVDKAQNERLEGLEKSTAVLRKDVGDQSEQLRGALNVMALSTGLLLEGVVGLGIQSQASIPIESDTGENLGNARGSFAPSLHIGANIGIDMLDGDRYYLQGRIAPTWNEGPDGKQDAGIRYGMGAAAEWNLGGVHRLGPFAELDLADEGGNVIDPNAMSREVLIGLSYTCVLNTNPDAAHLAFNVQAGAGYENTGSAGDGFRPTTDSSPVLTLRLSIMPGWGSAGSSN